MDSENKENTFDNDTNDSQINSNLNNNQEISNSQNTIDMPIECDKSNLVEKNEKSIQSNNETISNINQNTLTQENKLEVSNITDDPIPQGNENVEIATEQNLNTNIAETNVPCSTDINQNMIPPIANYYNQYQTKNDGTKGLKIAIAILAILLVGIILFIVINVLIKDGEKSANKVNRTIMMYMVGSDLESEGAMATADLKDIKPQNIDLENIKFILMVGGATKWHNYVEEDEIAIYQLTEEGFVKEKTYKLSSMAKSSNLTKFLEYVYTNHPAKNYDLIFWNHGLGTLGLEQDEIYDDFMSITDLEKALKNSPFNKGNKMEAIIFSTCLSGNLHIAEIVSDYAEYMVASEEIMWVSPLLDKFNFIEQIEVDDDGKDIGIKYIKNFEESNNYFYKLTKKALDGTYSVIDLSKIDELSEKVDSYLSSLNLEEDYKSIARVRSKIETYGMEIRDYDTVDLYTLVDSIGRLADSKNKKELLNTLEDTVIYNWSKNDYSHGISIYFPYYGNSDYLTMHFSLLKKISSAKYYKFIKDFRDMRANRVNLDSTLNEIESSANINEVMLKLPSDKIEDFASGSIIIYKLTNDNNYLPIYSKEDIKLNDEGNIVFTNNTKVLKVLNNDTGISEYIHLIKSETNDDEYFTYAKLKDKEGKFVSVIIYIKFDEDNPNGVIDKVTKYNEGLPTMAILELEEYVSIEFLNSKYNIMNDFGEYIDEWYEEHGKTSFEVSLSNYNFELNNLEANGEFFAIFKINDIYNNNYYSKLIQIQ